MVEYRFPLRGEIDITSAPLLRKQLLGVANTTTGDLVLDCEELTFIDSAVIATLLSIRRVLHIHGRRMRLVNLRGIARHATDALGLTETFTFSELEPA
jgi:anti-anti-sigma factor